MNQSTEPFLRFIVVDDRVYVGSRVLDPSDDHGYSEVIERAGEAWDWERALLSYRLGHLRGEGTDVTVEYVDDLALRSWADRAGYHLRFGRS